MPNNIHTWGKMVSSLLVRLCYSLLVCLPSKQVVAPSLNALTVPGVPSSYVKWLFEQPSDFSNNQALSQLSDAYMLYASPPCTCCYWVEMGHPTLAPTGSTPVPCVASWLRPTKMVYFVRYVWYETIDCVVMSIDDYLHWGQIEEGWVCPKCSREAIPFWDVSS